MNKKVIYTAIFGGKDILQEPKSLPEGFDFVCFTDDRNVKSGVWDIRYMDAPFEDPVRSARYCKVLAHKHLPGYDISVWMDGNMVVKGDINKLIEKYLKEYNLAVYNHYNQKKRFLGMFWVRDISLSRNCVYEEAKDLLFRNKNDRHIDDPILIQNQINRYQAEGYPKNNGLAVTRVLIRKHNESRVKDLMELWWSEIKNGSRRDQLSFNYAVWRLSFPFVYIKGDPRYDGYFMRVKHVIRENYKQ